MAHGAKYANSMWAAEITIPASGCESEIFTVMLDKTHKHLRLIMSGNEQTDGQTLPSTLSPSFAVDKKMVS